MKSSSCFGSCSLAMSEDSSILSAAASDGDSFSTFGWMRSVPCAPRRPAPKAPGARLLRSAAMLALKLMVPRPEMPVFGVPFGAVSTSPPKMLRFVGDVAIGLPLATGSRTCLPWRICFALSSALPSDAICSGVAISVSVVYCAGIARVPSNAAGILRTLAISHLLQNM